MAAVERRRLAWPQQMKPWLFEALAENAARICEANDTLIYRVDGQRLRGVTDYGPLPGQLGKGPTLTRLSVPSRCVIDRRTIHIHDLAAVSTDDFRANFLRSHGTRTVLATPLLRQGVPIGVILIRRMEVRPFSDRQIGLLETFADQAVIAIENVRLFQQLQEKTEQLELANARLTELDRLKSDFVANVSHELRTPLTAIKGSVDLLLRCMAGPLNEKQTQHLNWVSSNTQYLAGLINDLLDLAKIEAGKIEMHRARISLEDLLHEIVETLRPVAAEKRILFDATDGSSSVPVWGDRDKITQILMNLLGNAIKFTPENGTVAISVTKKGAEWVQVSVIDTGPGISAEAIDKIFDKFYQFAANGRQRPKGSGLGLAITRGLVELHGGRLWVESEANRGSTFSFTLPAATPELT